jgi:CheY-like chemotaxis protein
MKLRVLVVEPNADDLLFLGHALGEIEEGSHWTNWVQVEAHPALTWKQAATVLASVPIDVILLDLNLPDSQGAETFRRVQSLAPRIPVVVLAGLQDRDLAAQLVREGAQDFLLQGQIDCGPLVHCLENAIERQRLLAATRATSMTDPLTGLLNRGGFFTFASRDRMLAEQLNLRFVLIVADAGLADAGMRPDAAVRSDLSAGSSGQHRVRTGTLAGTLSANAQTRDLALVDAADQLRNLAGPTGLIARLSETRFALSLFDHPAERVESALARIRSATAGGSDLQGAGLQGTGLKTTRPFAMGAAVYDATNPAPLEALIEQAEFDLVRGSVAVFLHSSKLHSSSLHSSNDESSIGSSFSSSSFDNNPFNDSSFTGGDSSGPPSKAVAVRGDSVSGDREGTHPQRISKAAGTSS